MRVVVSRLMRSVTMHQRFLSCRAMSMHLISMHLPAVQRYIAVLDLSLAYAAPSGQIGIWGQGNPDNSLITCSVFATAKGTPLRGKLYRCSDAFHWKVLGSKMDSTTRD